MSYLTLQIPVIFSKTNNRSYGLFTHGCTMEGNEEGENSKSKLGQKLKYVRRIEVRSRNG